MFDRLSGGEQPGIKGRGTLVIVHDRLALFENTDDGIAGLALRLRADFPEDLFETVNLTLGLAIMLLERCLQIRALRRLRHLGKGRKNLLLCEVDVLECVVKQIFQSFGLGHHKLPAVIPHWAVAAVTMDGASCSVCETPSTTPLRSPGIAGSASRRHYS